MDCIWLPPCIHPCFAMHLAYSFPSHTCRHIPPSAHQTILRQRFFNRTAILGKTIFFSCNIRLISLLYPCLFLYMCIQT